MEQIIGKSIDWDLNECHINGLDYVFQKALTERQKEIVLAYYRDGRTLESIGEDYGVGRERIRQIVATSLKLMRYPPFIEKIIKGSQDFKDIDVYANEKISEFNKYAEKRMADIATREAALIRREQAFSQNAKLFIAEKYPLADNSPPGANLDNIFTRLEKLELPERAYNGLRRAGFYYLEDITRVLETDPFRFLHLKNVGEKTRKDIVAVVDAYLDTEKYTNILNRAEAKSCKISKKDEVGK